MKTSIKKFIIKFFTSVPMLIVFINLVAFIIVVVMAAIDNFILNLSSAPTMEKIVENFKEQIVFFGAIAFLIINIGIIVLRIMDRIDRKRNPNGDKNNKS